MSVHYFNDSIKGERGGGCVLWLSILDTVSGFSSVDGRVLWCSDEMAWCYSREDRERLHGRERWRAHWGYIHGRLNSRPLHKWGEIVGPRTNQSILSPWGLVAERPRCWSHTERSGVSLTGLYLHLAHPAETQITQRKGLGATLIRWETQSVHNSYGWLITIVQWSIYLDGEQLLQTESSMAWAV